MVGKFFRKVFDSVFISDVVLWRCIVLSAIGGLIGMRWFASEPGTTALVIGLIILYGPIAYAEGVQDAATRSRR